MKVNEAVGVRQLMMTVTALRSDCKWQVGPMPQRSWLYGTDGTESHPRAIFIITPFYRFALN